MKAWKKYFPLSLMMIIIMGSCSPKVSNEKIDSLEGQEAVLKKSTELNKLKQDLEKNLLKQADLTKEVEEINRAAAASAKANPISDEAAKDAKQAKKLTDQLKGVNSDISDLRKDIEKKEKELKELKARVEAAPAN
ncbi:hypothetical protein GZH53_17065 [Flavihumibacter sp. R14]|nr:hypothetical protein [Flavihumibacter soli]